MSQDSRKMTRPDHWPLEAFPTSATTGFVPEPGRWRRDWMYATPDHFAQRCLPLTVANQAGWAVRLPFDVAARWNGSDSKGGIELEVSDPDHPNAGLVADHFGSGVLTFMIPFLFRTVPDVSLLVRGAPNFWIEGAHPLEGLVETDWVNSTFTMNWKLLTPHRLVRFRAGDPICFLQPFDLGRLEAAEPRIEPLSDRPETEQALRAWSASRDTFNGDPDRTPSMWQKDYYVGRHHDGADAHEHRKRLRVAPFAGASESSEHVALSERPSADRSAPASDGRRAQFHVTDEFFADSYELRAAVERHAATQGIGNGVWDLFHVNDLYAYLRTQARHILPAPGIARLERALRNWGWRNLGMGRTTALQLSLYLDGCGQGLHNDAGGGYHAFIYSLSESDRFTGGETLLLRDEPYWDTARTGRSGAGSTFVRRVAPVFNRLLVFDTRIIHGVETVRSNWDPSRGRLVIQGQFLPGGLRIRGGLDRQATADAISAAGARIDERIPELRSSYKAQIGVRVDVARDGSATATVLSAWIAPLVDGEVPADLVERAMAELVSVEFPAGPGSATFTLPVDDLGRPEVCLVTTEEYGPEPVEGGYSVTDPSGTEHVLNASAAFILMSCTGDVDAMEIADAVRETFGLDEAPVDAVADCMEELRLCGLVRPVEE